MMVTRDWYFGIRASVSKTREKKSTTETTHVSIITGPYLSSSAPGGILRRPNFWSIMLNSDLDVQKYEYKFPLNNYLKAQPNPPVHSLAGLIASGKYHKASLEKFLTSAESYENGLNEPDYKDRRVKIDDLSSVGLPDGEKQRGRAALSTPEAPAGDDRRDESGGAQWHPGLTRGISGHYGSGRVFHADGERADRGAGRDRIPRSAV